MASCRPYRCRPSPLPASGRWLGFRAGVYEGSPQIGSVGFDSAFADGAGGFYIGSATVRADLGEKQPQAALFSAGAWYRTTDVTVGNQTFPGAGGGYGLVD